MARPYVDKHHVPAGAAHASGIAAGRADPAIAIRLPIHSSSAPYRERCYRRPRPWDNWPAPLDKAKIFLKTMRAAYTPPFEVIEKQSDCLKAFLGRMTELVAVFAVLPANYQRPRARSPQKSWVCKSASHKITAKWPAVIRCYSLFSAVLARHSPGAEGAACARVWNQYDPRISIIRPQFSTIMH